MKNKQTTMQIAAVALGLVIAASILVVAFQEKTNIQEVKPAKIEKVSDYLKIKKISQIPIQAHKNSLKGDMNHDGNFDQEDVDLLIAIYGEQQSENSEYFWNTFAQYGDFDDNGVIELYDLSQLLSLI